MKNSVGTRKLNLRGQM